MTYAVIQTGGKQYRVTEGDTIEVELTGEAKTMTFTPIAISQDGKLGDVTKAKVTATVVDQIKGDKVIVFKMKAKKGYRVKAGHRQRYSQLKIDKITA